MGINEQTVGQGHSFTRKLDYIQDMDLFTRSESLEMVADQHVSAFKPLSKTSSMLFDRGDPASGSRRAYDLIAGGNGSSGTEADDEGKVSSPKKKPFVFTKVYGDEKKAYLARAKALGLSGATQNEFFSEPGLVRKIALTTKLLIRLGFDQNNEVFKIYIKKDNFNTKPSIIHVLLPEVDDFTEYVKGQLFPTIDDGIKIGQLAFKLEDGEMAKPSYSEFWEHDSIYMADSGRLRLRTVHKMGRCYQFFLNNPVFGSMFPGYYGPRIMLSRQELETLVGILLEIKAECPPLDEM